LIEFRVLGPVEVSAGGRRVDAGQPRQRAVLAALLADAGRPVPVDTLIDRIWGQAPPRAVRPSLQANVTRLRQMLEQAAAAGEPPVKIAFAAGCYLLDVDPLQVDLHLFRHLATSAEPQPAQLQQALRLWRGEPLAGVAGAWAERTRQAWRREQLAAAVAWGQAELQAANPAAVIPLLSDLAGEHPLTESLAAVLMRALAAAGRPAEALSHYDVVRRHLVAELGTDPSADLQEVYQSILHGMEPAVPPTGRRAADAAPAQLPADVSGFTGRDEHLARLDAFLRGDGPGSSTGAPVLAVSGTAGVGKTTLVVHWAHTVADQFPDGQLYVNLRGFDPSGRAMDPADAVRGFLDALGVTPDRIPARPDAQAALYRSQLAGKRVLVVLDNARDVEQVHPLLPATAGALAVVTSRNQLTGLVATVGAHPLPLDVLTRDEARDLITNRLGADRTDAEPHAVDSIVASCARLPIALAIAAARARQNTFPLAALADELVETGDRLDALDTGDPAVQVRAVFSWSYAALSTEAQRLFRLLGLHPGPDVTAAAAASLGGHRPALARRLLGELTHASLVTEHVQGRYSCHDLLRVYAADLTATLDPDAARHAASIRLLDHYLHTAYAADRLLYPARDPIEVPLGPAAPGSHPESVADHQQAMAWFAGEHPVLLAAARYAADLGRDAQVGQLAWAVDTFLFRRGHVHDRIAVWSEAVSAAERLGDLEAQASAHRYLARANLALGRDDEVQLHLDRSLDLCVRTGNQGGQAFVYNTLAQMYGKQQRRGEALDHARRALALYAAASNPRGQAMALSEMGWHSVWLGDYQSAIDYGRRSLALLQQVGDRRGQADVWDTVGYAHHHLGRHDEARDCYQQALDLVRDAGDRFAEAEILVHLGDTYAAAGDPVAARAAWDDALRIFVELDQPDARDVRAKLDALTPL